MKAFCIIIILFTLLIGIPCSYGQTTISSMQEQAAQDSLRSQTFIAFLRDVDYTFPEFQSKNETFIYFNITAASVEIQVYADKNSKKDIAKDFRKILDTTMLRNASIIERSTYYKRVTARYSSARFGKLTSSINIPIADILNGFKESGYRIFPAMSIPTYVRTYPILPVYHCKKMVNWYDKEALEELTYLHIDAATDIYILIIYCLCLLLGVITLIYLFVRAIKDVAKSGLDGRLAQNYIFYIFFLPSIAIAAAIVYMARNSDFISHEYLINELWYGKHYVSDFRLWLSLFFIGILVSYIFLYLNYIQIMVSFQKPEKDKMSPLEAKQDKWRSKIIHFALPFYVAKIFLQDFVKSWHIPNFYQTVISWIILFCYVSALSVHYYFFPKIRKSQLLQLDDMDIKQSISDYISSRRIHLCNIHVNSYNAGKQLPFTSFSGRDFYISDNLLNEFEENEKKFVILSALALKRKALFMITISPMTLLFASFFFVIGLCCAMGYISVFSSRIIYYLIVILSIYLLISRAKRWMQEWLERIYNADIDTVEYMGDTDAALSALMKLKQYNQIYNGNTKASVQYDKTILNYRLRKLVEYSKTLSTVS